MNDALKETLKELAGCIGSFLLQNIVGGVIGTIGVFGILHCARLWLRSVFSELYEFVFLFIVMAFIFGFILGAFRRFAEYYAKYTSKYKIKKELQERELDDFRHLDYDLKELVYEIYIKGSKRCDLKELDRISNYHSDSDFKQFARKYFKYEIISPEFIRLTLNLNTKRMLKKHPEVLNCLK